MSYEIFFVKRKSARFEKHQAERLRKENEKLKVSKH